MRLLAFFALGFAPALAAAQLSQSRLEDDCLQRLRPIVPREARFKTVVFGALGNNAAYYTVTYRFDDSLANGKRTAVCTYRRDGQWVSDDAASFKLAKELEPARSRKPD